MSELASREDRARAAWGADCPVWVLELARECTLTSQNKVAAAMGISAAVISNVLRAKYEGSYEAIEDRFNGAFKGQIVICPALGTMPTHECRDWRKKLSEFIAGDRQRVRMYGACTRCPVNAGGE